jgi:hypothetical protein
MKLAVFAPFGLMSREAGVMYLLANYLHKNGAEVMQLRCDGAQRACARDAVTPGFRTPFACAPCMSEQSALAQWAGVKSRSLSTLLGPEDVTQSRMWLAGLASDELFRAEFRGESLWQCCQEQFLSRWGLQGGQEISAEQEANLRDLFVAHIQVRVAAERFLSAVKPTLHFVAGGNEGASCAYLLEAKRAGGEVAVFGYDAETDSISVRSSGAQTVYQTSLILEGITSMRNEPRTWAPEVTAIVHEMLSFLGCAPDRVL